MINTIKRFTRLIPVKRSLIMSAVFLILSTATPANAFEIKPYTDGFIFNTTAQATTQTGINWVELDTPLLNNYVTQKCGINCTVNDYADAILKSNNFNLKAQIPLSLTGTQTNFGEAYTQYVYRSGYSKEFAMDSFRYSTKQPVDMPNAFKYNIDPSIVHPNSVILDNSSWFQCSPNAPCLSWGMGWDVTSTPPSDFTPGTMKATALFNIVKPNGTSYTHLAQSPVVFGVPATGQTSTNNNGWRHNFGNFYQTATQLNTNITVNDAVQLLRWGATYTSNIDGSTKWGFYDYSIPVPPSNFLIRLKNTTEYCNINNECITKTETSNPVFYTPNIEYPVPNTTPETGKSKNKVQVDLEINQKGDWETKQPILIVERQTPISQMDTVTKQCALGSELCVISLHKATPNGYVQCTVGNTNADCSEYIVGVDVNSPQIANNYQCRINGVVQPLTGCQQLEGKYNLPVPQYTNTDTQDGILACAPPGFQILNPLVFVQSTGCVLQYLFIPKTSISEIRNQIKYLMDNTVLQFPNLLINDFISPFTNMDLEFNPSPGECLGLGIPINVDDWTDKPGFEIIKDAGENMMLHPFQACSPEAIELSTWARNFEALVIYLGALFMGLNTLLSAFGFSMPFTKGKNKGEVGL